MPEIKGLNTDRYTSFDENIKSCGIHFNSATGFLDRHGGFILEHNAFPIYKNNKYFGALLPSEDGSIFYPNIPHKTMHKGPCPIATTNIRYVGVQELLANSKIYIGESIHDLEYVEDRLKRRRLI